jgi:hypothetical protein
MLHNNFRCKEPEDGPCAPKHVARRHSIVNKLNNIVVCRGRLQLIFHIFLSDTFFSIKWAMRTVPVRFIKMYVYIFAEYLLH